MLHDVVQRKKFYTLVLQKCLTRSKNTTVNGNKKDKLLNENGQKAVANQIKKLTMLFHL